MTRPIFPFKIDWAAPLTKRWSYDPNAETLGFGPEYLDLLQGEVIHGYEFAVYLTSPAEVQAWEVWWQQRVSQGQSFRLRDPRQNDDDSTYLFMRLATAKVSLEYLADNRAMCKLRLVELPFETMASSEEEPLWLYEFTEGATKTRYTSNQSTVAYNGATWQPAAITHAAIRETLTSSKSDCTIMAEFTPENPLSGRVPFATAGELGVSILRWSRLPELAENVFAGRVAAVTLEGNRLSAKCSNQRLIFESAVPQFYIQERCNHALYGTACGLVKADWDSNGTVVSIVRGLLTVAGAAITGKPENWFANGFAKVGNESIAIVRSLGASIYLASPMRHIEVGDVVICYAGCSKAKDVCKAKFDNFENFGGHPNVPKENISLKALEYDSAPAAGGK